MSVDVQVWINRTDELRPAVFAVSEDWVVTDDDLALERDEWQLLVSAPRPAPVGEADPTLAAALEGTEHLVDISLEPIGAPSEAFSVLSSVVTNLVNRCGGVAVDVETGDLIWSA